MDSCENGIYDCISPELVDAMNAADIMVLNNEFTYSTGGAPLDETEQRRIYDFLESISVNVEIDDDGVVSEAF